MGYKRFVFRMAEASAKRERLVMNRKGPREGYTAASEASHPLCPCRLPLRANCIERETSGYEAAWDRGRKGERR